MPEKLVFIDSQQVSEEPYTTADVLAKYANSDTRSVNRLIRTYQNDLKDFGVLRFSIRKPPKGSKGGRPRKVWHLNQEQASLIITYMDNTKPVRGFKKSLIHEFFTMYRLLAQQQASYEAGKAISKDLNQAIKDNPTFTHPPFDYINMNRLIYQYALGVSSSKLKHERHVKVGHSITEYLMADEAQAYQKVKFQVVTMLQMNLDRDSIKQALDKQGVLYQVTLPVKKGETIR